MAAAQESDRKFVGSVWTTSSYCGDAGCVEVSVDGSHIGLRDPKRPGAPVLTFTRDEWITFVAGIKNGEFDLR
jgi:hypothetical protein